MKDNVFIVNIKGFFFPPSICDNENLGNFLKNKIKLFMEHLFGNKICGGIWCNAVGLSLKGHFCHDIFFPEGEKLMYTN